MRAIIETVFDIFYLATVLPVAIPIPPISHNKGDFYDACDL